MHMIETLERIRNTYVKTLSLINNDYFDETIKQLRSLDFTSVTKPFESTYMIVSMAHITLRRAIYYFIGTDDITKLMIYSLFNDLYDSNLRKKDDEIIMDLIEEATSELDDLKLLYNQANRFIEKFSDKQVFDRYNQPSVIKYKPMKEKHERLMEKANDVKMGKSEAVNITPDNDVNVCKSRSSSKQYPHLGTSGLGPCHAIVLRGRVNNDDVVVLEHRNDIRDDLEVVETTISMANFGKEKDFEAHSAIMFGGCMETLSVFIDMYLNAEPDDVLNLTLVTCVSAFMFSATVLYDHEKNTLRYKVKPSHHSNNIEFLNGLDRNKYVLPVKPNAHMFLFSDPETTDLANKIHQEQGMLPRWFV